MPEALWVWAQTHGQPRRRGRVQTQGPRRRDLLGLVPYGPIQTVLTLGYFTLSALAYVDFPSELSLEIYHVVTILRLG